MKFIYTALCLVFLLGNIFAQKNVKEFSNKKLIPSHYSSVQEDIINSYTAVIAYGSCNNKLTVKDGSAFKVGDTVLLIQMKGAFIDSTNSPTFGNIVNYSNSGNYEFNYVSQKLGNQIFLKNKLIKNYDLPNGRVQLIRVPYFTNAVVNSTLSCLPWDGEKGGVLILNAAQNITLYANLDVSGNGFRGGIGYNSQIPQLNCFINQFNIPNSQAKDAGLKGESIVSLGSSILRGKGAPASGGGGGLGHNSGGGGGSNFGKGGFGGYQLNSCGGYPFDNRGVGGYQLNYSSTTDKIFLGGGGGAGNADNPQNLPPDGGNGGGIIIVKANHLITNGYKIISNGANAYECNMPQSLDCHDGMGGGGAGGTILMDVVNITGNLDLIQNGGKGADMIGAVIGGKVGSGGGGGGGVLFINSPSLAPNLNTIHNGGNNGVLTQFANDSYGATSGADGTNLFNLVLPFTTSLFKPNIDSVRIQYSVTNCNNFNFEGLGYTNSSAITGWAWNFGDGSSATVQNVSHTFSTAGNYTVTLVANDVNGCKDSILIPVSVQPVTAQAGSDTAYCSNQAVIHILNGSSNASNFSWSPAALLNNSTAQNPTATILNTTTFYLTSTNSNGCTAKDSITISVNPLPQINTIANKAICQNDSIQLTTTGTATSFQWLPATAVNNPTLQNPWFLGTANTQMIVTGSDGFCNASDTVYITVNPSPIVKSITDTVLCEPQPITLNTFGAQTYSWMPASNLNNPNIANPIFTGTNHQQYQFIVTGQDALGCKAYDTVNIEVTSKPNFNLPNSFETCKNVSVQLNTNNPASYAYQWSPNNFLNNPTLPNPIATATASTIYMVTITENICFSDTVLQVSLLVNELPTVSAHKANDIDCTNTETQLTAAGALHYEWWPATGLNNTLSATPTASPVTSTTYLVTGTDSKGCSNKDSVKVMVLFDKMASYYVPNSFTPNDDQINDCFGISYWNLITELEFKIYNRYGEMVFSTKNKADCWNGKFKGRAAEMGNYIYFIKANTLCGKLFRKGNLLLIR